MRQIKTKATGWLRDLPDHRDLTIDHDMIRSGKETLGVSQSVKQLVSRTKANKIKIRIPAKVDLRPYFPAIEDQESIGSCTANAGVGLLEYYEMRAFGKHTNASRLFLYKTTRNLLGWDGDTGAYLRTTMAAMALFGVPPEDYWSYDIEYYDEFAPLVHHECF